MGRREEWMRIVVIFTGFFKITVEHDGNETMNIPVDGSGRVSVLDISNDTESDDSGLLCWYRTRIAFQLRWQLNGVFIPRVMVDDETHYHGWSSKILRIAPYLIMLLQRTQNMTGSEGVFTCYCYYDDEVPVSVGIFYPSE